MDTKATVVSSGMVTDQKAGKKRVQMRLAGPDIGTFDLIVDGATAPLVGSEVTLTVAIKAAPVPAGAAKPNRLGIRNDQTEVRTADEAEVAALERAAAEHRAHDHDEALPHAPGAVGTVGGQTSKTGQHPR